MAQLEKEAKAASDAYIKAQESKAAAFDKKNHKG